MGKAKHWHARVIRRRPDKSELTHAPFDIYDATDLPIAIERRAYAQRLAYETAGMLRLVTDDFCRGVVYSCRLEQCYDLDPQAEDTVEVIQYPDVHICAQCELPMYDQTLYCRACEAIGIA